MSLSHCTLYTPQTVYWFLWFQNTLAVTPPDPEAQICFSLFPALPLFTSPVLGICVVTHLPCARVHLSLTELPSLGSHWTPRASQFLTNTPKARRVGVSEKVQSTWDPKPGGDELGL